MEEKISEFEDGAIESGPKTKNGEEKGTMNEQRASVTPGNTEYSRVSLELQKGGREGEGEKK